MTTKLLPGFALSCIALLLLFPSGEREDAENAPVPAAPPAAPEMPASRLWRRSIGEGALSPVIRDIAGAVPGKPEVRVAELSFAKALPAMRVTSSAAPMEEYILTLDFEPVRFSTTALASLGGDGSAVSGTAAPHDAEYGEYDEGGVAYPELPPKGIVLRAEGSRFREEQQLRETGRSAGNSVYNHKGALYSVSAEYDWSADSIVGVRFGMLDSTLQSLYDGDSRENRMEAYRANALYRGNLFGVYPVSAEAFYGWADHEGTGRAGSPDGTFDVPWKENPHKSTMYGFSLKAGLPLLFLNSLKVLPEAGVRYAKLTTKGYSVNISDGFPVPLDIPQRTSTSIAVPVGVTAKMDFPRTWGIFTPRAGLGVEFEFDETATGVHTMHAAAASRVNPDPINFTVSPTEPDPAHRFFAGINLGLDLKTVGGWEVAAEYRRKWVESYIRDDFSLEIGRCF